MSCAKKNKEYYAKNHLKIKAKRYTSIPNYMINRARNGKYRANKKKLTLPWEDFQALKDFYANCPDGHEVDHIIPLAGKCAQGIHTLKNLQYLPKVENAIKKNCFDVFAEKIEDDVVVEILK